MGNLHFCFSPAITPITLHKVMVSACSPQKEKKKKHKMKFVAYLINLKEMAGFFKWDRNMMCTLKTAQTFPFCFFFFPL